MTLEDNPCDICYIAGIHLFTVFFQLLTWTILGNPVNTTEKSTLKLVKLPSLKVIYRKPYKRLYIFATAKNLGRSDDVKWRK